MGQDRGRVATSRDVANAARATVCYLAALALWVVEAFGGYSWTVIVPITLTVLAVYLVHQIEKE